VVEAGSTKLVVTTAYNWKGWQKENVIHLVCERGMGIKATAELLNIPRQSIWTMLCENPAYKRKPWRYNRKKHLPEEWREHSK